MASKHKLKRSPKLRLEFVKIAGTGKRSHGRVLVAGTLHLVGNRVYSIGRDRSVAIWSFDTPRWRILGWSCPIGVNHAGTIAADKIYLTGGYGPEVLIEFDIVLEEVNVVQCPDVAPLKRKWMTAVFASWLREVAYFGGFETAQGAKARSNEIHCFNVDTKSWRQLEMKGSSPSPRSGHAATTQGFNMLVYGGYDSYSNYLRDLWIARLEPGRHPAWTEAMINGRAPIGRAQSLLNRLGGFLILFGGWARNINVTGEMEVFAMATSEWRCARTSPSRQSETSSAIELVGSSAGALESDWRTTLSVQAHKSVLYFTETAIFRLSIPS